MEGMQPQDPPVFLIPLIVGGFFVVFPLFWMGILALLARFSGYAELAQSFPGPATPPGRAFSRKSATLKGMRYRNILTVGVGPEGLYLALSWPFTFRHPPILVPWSEVAVSPPQPAFLVGTSTEVGFPRHPGLTLRLWGSLGEEVAKACPHLSPG